MRRDPNTRICIEPARNGGVYCLTSDDCSKCGWCLEVERRRKEAIGTTPPPKADTKKLAAQRLRRTTNLLAAARQVPTQGGR